MAEYLIQDTTLIGIADKIRVLSGGSDTMTPAEMQSTLETHNDDMNEVLEAQDAKIAELQEILSNAASAKVSVSDDGNGNVVIVTNGANIYVNRRMSGDSSTTIITFTVRGTSYQAEEGMTWAQWVNSGYNTDNFTLQTAMGMDVICIPNAGMFVSDNSDIIGDPIESSAIIIANYAYGGTLI